MFIETKIYLRFYSVYSLHTVCKKIEILYQNTSKLYNKLFNSMVYFQTYTSTKLCRYDMVIKDKPADIHKKYILNSETNNPISKILLAVACC